MLPGKIALRAKVPIGSWPIHSRELLFHGIFAAWNIHPEHIGPGTFILMSILSLELYYTHILLVVRGGLQSFGDKKFGRKTLGRHIRTFGRQH